MTQLILALDDVVSSLFSSRHTTATTALTTPTLTAPAIPTPQLVQGQASQPVLPSLLPSLRWYDKLLLQMTNWMRSNNVTVPEKTLPHLHQELIREAKYLNDLQQQEQELTGLFLTGQYSEQEYTRFQDELQGQYELVNDLSLQALPLASAQTAVSRDSRLIPFETLSTKDNQVIRDNVGSAFDERWASPTIQEILEQKSAAQKRDEASAASANTIPSIPSWLPKAALVAGGAAATAVALIGDANDAHAASFDMVTMLQTIQPLLLGQAEGQRYCPEQHPDQWTRMTNAENSKKIIDYDTSFQAFAGLLMNYKAKYGCIVVENGKPNFTFDLTPSARHATQQEQAAWGTFTLTNLIDTLQIPFDNPTHAEAAQQMMRDAMINHFVDHPRRGSVTYDELTAHEDHVNGDVITVVPKPGDPGRYEVVFNGDPKEDLGKKISMNRTDETRHIGAIYWMKDTRIQLDAEAFVGMTDITRLFADAARRENERRMRQVMQGEDEYDVNLGNAILHVIPGSNQCEEKSTPADGTQRFAVNGACPEGSMDAYPSGSHFEMEFAGARNYNFTVNGVAPRQPIPNLAFAHPDPQPIQVVAKHQHPNLIPQQFAHLREVTLNYTLVVTQPELPMGDGGDTEGGIGGPDEPGAPGDDAIQAGAGLQPFPNEAPASFPDQLAFAVGTQGEYTSYTRIPATCTANTTRSPNFYANREFSPQVDCSVEVDHVDQMHIWVDELGGLSNTRYSLIPFEEVVVEVGQLQSRRPQQVSTPMTDRDPANNVITSGPYDQRYQYLVRAVDTQAGWFRLFGVRLTGGELPERDEEEPALSEEAAPEQPAQDQPSDYTKINDPFDVHTETGDGRAFNRELPELVQPGDAYPLNFGVSVGGTGFTDGLADQLRLDTTNLPVIDVYATVDPVSWDTKAPGWMLLTIGYTYKSIDRERAVDEEHASHGGGNEHYLRIQPRFIIREDGVRYSFAPYWKGTLGGSANINQDLPAGVTPVGGSVPDRYEKHVTVDVSDHEAGFYARAQPVPQDASDDSILNQLRGDLYFVVNNRNETSTLQLTALSDRNQGTLTREASQESTTITAGGIVDFFPVPFVSVGAGLEAYVTDYTTTNLDVLTDRTPEGVRIPARLTLTLGPVSVYAKTKIVPGELSQTPVTVGICGGGIKELNDRLCIEVSHDVNIAGSPDLTGPNVTFTYEDN